MALPQLLVCQFVLKWACLAAAAFMAVAGGFTDKEKTNAIATLVQAGVEERAILSI